MAKYFASHHFCSTAFALLIAVGVHSAPAAAAVDQGVTCGVAKHKAAVQKLAAKVKCYDTGFKKGAAVDTNCLAAAEAKFSSAFLKADAKGVCAGNAGTVETLIDNTVAALISEVPAATTTTTLPPTNCDLGNCTTCYDCAQNAGGACHSLSETCTNNAACIGLYTCLSACAANDFNCSNACVNNNPNGVAPLQAVLSCLDSACAASCAP